MAFKPLAKNTPDFRDERPAASGCAGENLKVLTLVAQHARKAGLRVVDPPAGFTMGPPGARANEVTMRRAAGAASPYEGLSPTDITFFSYSFANDSRHAVILGYQKYAVEIASAEKFTREVFDRFVLEAEQRAAGAATAWV